MASEGQYSGRTAETLCNRRDDRSPRRDDFRVLAVPRDLAAQRVNVLIQDPVRRHRAPVPVLDPPQYSLQLFLGPSPRPST